MVLICFVIGFGFGFWLGEFSCGLFLLYGSIKFEFYVAENEPQPGWLGMG